MPRGERRYADVPAHATSVKREDARRRGLALTSAAGTGRPPSPGRDQVQVSVNAAGRCVRSRPLGFGRSLFYIDRDDGLDVGREMVRAGWAEVFVFERDFQRLSGYLDAEADAEDTGAGVWKRCGGDFHFSRAEELRERRLSAIAFMRRYYRRLSNNQFATAWGMLARRVRRDFGRFASWRAGYRRSLGTTVTAARARLSGKRVVVSVRLRARDRDACSRRILRQYFRGRCILAPRRDSWVAVKVAMRKTGGGQVRLSKSECAPPEPNPPPPPPPPPPPRTCDPSYPTVCIPPPPPDLDCDDIPYRRLHRAWT